MRGWPTIAGTLMALGALALSGCATPEAPSISFADALAMGNPAPEVLAAPPVAKLRPKPRPRPPPPPPPVTAEQLRNALADFQFRAAEERAQAKPGAPLPDAEAHRWQALLDLIDRHVQGPPADIQVGQLGQAQAILEAELEHDARLYAEFPTVLADRVVAGEAQLATRAIQLHPPVLHADRKLRLEWPLEQLKVTSLFGRRFHPIERRYRQHEGVDLAADQGAVVSAAGPGIVKRAGWYGNCGFEVEVAHGSGVTTRYCHLLQPLVQVGDALDTGDILGLVGTTGESTGPHLHFEVWRNGHPLDPLRQLKVSRGIEYFVAAARSAPVAQAHPHLIKLGAADRPQAPRHL